MRKLLQLKHWQLFSLTFGIPILADIIGFESFFTSDTRVSFFIVYLILTLIVAGTFLGWFWALGTAMFKKLPSTVKMNLRLFKAFLIVPIIYGLFLLKFIFDSMSSGQQPNSELFAIIVPMHLFTMFCTFYCLYFNAKTLKAVEWQRNVTFSDYAGEFFLIWFFPIGIWFIQPRINKLIFDKPTSQFD